MHEDQTSIFFATEKEPSTDWLQLDRIITDRGSKYSVTIGCTKTKVEVDALLVRIKKDKKYRTATHNSLAYRLATGTQIVDGKSDDGETGAGMAMLRVLHRNNLVNVAVVVTRWYGGVKLHGDRFRHIVDGVQLVIDEMFNKKDSSI
ncbi:YigZ family protein [Candidatus Uhrbacteria bacterium]|jgi:putative IMPACT (imprinted ancient) family translation regulator|nr:YigZ family protein [Candidatus Uhrbacteria bacterium]